MWLVVGFKFLAKVLGDAIESGEYREAGYLSPTNGGNGYRRIHQGPQVHHSLDERPS